MSFYQWLTNIDRPFAFLLVLPFLVGLAGLVSEYLRQLWAKRLPKNVASRRDMGRHRFSIVS